MIMWSVRDSNIGSITFSRHWIERFEAVDRARALHLRRRRQQVDAVLPHHRGHRRRRRRVGIDHHQQVELLHRLDHFLAAGLAVGRMAPEDHRAQVRVLVEVLVLLQHGVDPARHRDAGLFHHRLRGELLLDPFVVHAPHRGTSASTTRRRCRSSPAANRGSGRRRSRPARCRGRGRCWCRRRRRRRCRARAAGCRRRARSRCRWCAGSGPSPRRWCWAGSSPSSRRRRAPRLPSCR